MMTKKTKVVLGALCLTACGIGTSHAALIDRGGGLIYDDVLNITWLQDAGYALGWLALAHYRERTQLGWMGHNRP